MKLMDLETGKRWAQAEANMNRTAFALLDTRINEVKRYTIASVDFILGDIPMTDNSAYRHCLPVATYFPLP